MDDPKTRIVRAYDPKLPLAESSTPPAAWYNDPLILDLERRNVFSHSWQLIGRTDQVREPGQYFTLELAGEPILVIRGHDNELRGFFNVCRHHAAAVMTQCEGRADNLRCPYHGWTYDFEGKLILTPEFAGVANFDRSANSLVPVQIAAWQGWVFAKLDDGDPTLAEFLGADLIERLEPLNLEHYSWFERRSYFLNCNWKVFVDNYLDGGYHVPHIHSGLSSVLDNSKYQIATGERFCLQSSPIASERGEDNTAALRKGKRANYLWIYPNFMINIYDEVMDTNLVIPRGVDKTEVVFDYYFAEISVPARERNLASITVSEQIQAEDVAICESVQRGLNSRAYDTGRLSVRREAGEHLFHRLLHADLTSGIASQSEP
jgi:phenylpropionate dioxygenase-like ring-hydroxylating dioxygenase large terminal subunit